MFDFERFLKNNPNGTMGATDGYTVTMRFMRYLFNENNRVFFCTNSRKHLCGLLRENPRVTSKDGVQTYRILENHYDAKPAAP